MKNLRYIIYACVLVFCGAPLNAETQHHHYLQLNNPLLKILDGSPIGFGAYRIGIIIDVLKQIRILAWGVLDKETQTRTGIYEFQGNHYSLEELYTIESEADSHTKTALREVLNQAVTDILKILEPLIAHAHSAKKVILPLMYESCERRHKMDSFILTWSDSEPGNEEKDFTTHMTNFNQLYHYCVDLTNFLGDILFSCPIGVDQFKAEARKRAEQNN